MTDPCIPKQSAFSCKAVTICSPQICRMQLQWVLLGKWKANWQYYNLKFKTLLILALILAVQNAILLIWDMDRYSANLCSMRTKCETKLQCEKNSQSNRKKYGVQIHKKQRKSSWQCSVVSVCLKTHSKQWAKKETFMESGPAKSSAFYQLQIYNLLLTECTFPLSMALGGFL